MDQIDRCSCLKHLPDSKFRGRYSFGLAIANFRGMSIHTQKLDLDLAIAGGLHNEIMSFCRYSYGFSGRC